MALGISVYDAGVDNAIADGECSNACTAPRSIIKNIRWGTHDSVNELVGEMVVGRATESLEDCEPGCTECRECWNEFSPDIVQPVCLDKREMKYGAKCPNKKTFTDELCTGEGRCVKSYPFGDPEKMRSVEAACRTVPALYDQPAEVMRDVYDWSDRKCKKKYGLCSFGCKGKNGTCFNSWLKEDEDKWAGPSAMCRCIPKK